MLMLLTCLSKTQLWLFFTRLSIGEIALGCMSWFCGLGGGQNSIVMVLS